MGRDWPLATGKSNRAAAPFPCLNNPERTKPMKATRREILALAAMSALGPGPASAETASQPDKAPAESNQADFDQVWELVRDRFYDPHLNGLDWQEERARFRP